MARPLIIFISLLIISTAEGQILRLDSSDDGLISDGINGAEASVTASCHHQYGFLPCTENAAGYIFMIVVYQVLLIVGGQLIGSGSEVLFHNTGPEFGGILFRISKALPSMMLMIISGIFSNKEDAQSQVSVVVGVYAGVTVFGLTVQWFMCMVSASKSLKKDSDKHREEEALQSNCFPKLRILIDNGVKVDKETCKTAGIMLLSLIPYLVLQLVYVFPTSSGKRVMTLIALIVSSLSVILYFAYQIWDPWMQKRSLNYSKFDIVRRMKAYKMKDEDVIKEMFRTFNQDNNAAIDEGEFVKGVCLEKAIKSVHATTERTRVFKVFDELLRKEEIVYDIRDFFKAVLQVLLGIAMLTFLAGPLMQNVLQLSNAMKFPSFIISFVAVPLAMNARAALEALLPASRKRDETASLTFSEIYGGVIMNNIVGLTTLLAIVYAKDLTWDFSAEVLTILVVCGIIGAQAFFSKTYHLWTCIPAFLLYPISLGLFYFVQLFFNRN